MSSIRYSAAITHTSKTIHALFRTQYYSYSKLRILLRFILGFILACSAVMLSLPVWAKGILIASGAWLIVSQDFPAQVRADRVLQARGGKLPVMRYAFGDDGLNVSGEGSMDIPYAKISRLIHDSEYLYLFIMKDSVCMMDRPENSGEFMKFIAEKTGLEWQTVKSVFAMNIDDLKEIFLRKS